MAGVYIHIPFCKQACTYCDFHFSTTFSVYRDELINCLIKEIQERKDYLNDQLVETIYFGGGTPSLLTGDEVERLLKAVYKNFNCSKQPEITLEANPDDISSEQLTTWKAAGINRLSIGIQSFDDVDLKWMNRAHNALESEKSVKMALEYGFLVTIDLIYGLPNVSNDQWLNNLEKATALQPHHISAYCLTVEENTVLDKWIKKGQISSVESERQAEQFDLLVEFLEEKGFEQYEISNFARDDNYAQHNSNYWRGKWYIGIGPSAHSFNGVSRAWNVSNNQRYIQAIQMDGEFNEQEILTEKDRFNELLMTGLRTKWGIDLEELSGIVELEESFYEYLQKGIEKGEITQNKNQIILTKQGRLLADKIASDLFLV
jgi:oxygen-independent coproporphyrinogen-3 oxidase